MFDQDANNSVEDETVNTSLETDLATEETTQDDIVDDETTDLEEDNSEDDSEDIEWDGKQYRLPKELKDALLRRDDYTRKTQEVAEQRKAVEAERETLNRRIEAEKALVSEYARVENLKQAVESYRNVDWDAAEEQNPELAAKEWRRMTLLQQQLQNEQTELQTKIDSRLKEQQSQRDQALQETGKVLTRDIPGFNQAMAQELVKEAAKFGFTQEDLLNDPDPRAWKLLHALWKSSRDHSKKATGEIIAKQSTTAPIKVVGAKSPPPSPLSDRADTKAWMEARMKQARR